MPAPFTIVTLMDEDGDEFPIRLPGVYVNNLGADVAAALDILKNDTETHPGTIDLDKTRVEYFGQEAAATQEP